MKKMKMFYKKKCKTILIKWIFTKILYKMLKKLKKKTKHLKTLFNKILIKTKSTKKILYQYYKIKVIFLIINLIKIKNWLIIWVLMKKITQ